MLLTLSFTYKHHLTKFNQVLSSKHHIPLSKELGKLITFDYDKFKQLELYDYDNSNRSTLLM